MHGPDLTFLRLDDLTAEIACCAPPVFLALETSPGNFQGWLALSGNEDKDFARRVRKGVGAGRYRQWRHARRGGV